MRQRTFILIPVVLLIMLLSLSGCERHSAVWSSIDSGESLIDSHPDSSLTILDGIRVYRLGGKAESALYALLKSTALDKNYIDTTTFDVLQPTIDYYLNNDASDLEVSRSGVQVCQKRFPMIILGHVLLVCKYRWRSGHLRSQRE